MSDSKSQWLIPPVLVICLAGAIWYFWPMPEEPAPIAVPAQPVPAKVGPATPRYPVPQSLHRTDRPDLVPLPPLDDSDKYFELALVNLFGGGIGQLLVDDALIEKSVTSIDNLTRSHVAERIRPLGSISGPFLANAGDSVDVYTLSPDNYKRYNFLAELLADADTERLIETYRRFYPLLQQAYVNLGYPDGYLNDRVIAVIDHLLAAPQPERPILLIRPHVLYEYADPDLEALSSGQKLLIRMGDDNAARVKQFLAELRVYLVAL